MDRFLEFAGNHTLLVTALLASFFLLVFSELRRKASGLVNIPAEAAVRLINNDALVIDLRNSDAFGRGHIVGARNIAADDIDAKLDTLTQWKQKPVLAVCDAGMTSTRVVDKLRKAGFENVYGLRGGMGGWSQAGMPVVSGRKTRSKGRKDKDRKKK